MKLFFNKASPFVRKVDIVLHLLGLADQVEYASVAAMPGDPENELVSSNPLGKIPTLITDSGRAIYDSRTICRYLDSEFGGKLYPAPPELWDSLIIEATAEGMMDASVLMTYEWKARPEELRSKEWVDAQWFKVKSAIRAIESSWMEKLNGPMDIGQIAVGSAFGYLDFRHENREWRKESDTLADWYAKFSQKDIMKATRPD